MIDRIFVISLVLCFIIFTSILQGQKSKRISIIPLPQKIKINSGEFWITNKTIVRINTDTIELQPIAEEFALRLRVVTGYPIPIINSQQKHRDHVIELDLVKDDTNLGREGYRLIVGKNTLTLLASAPAGVFYGIQSLYQLLPPEIEGSEIASNVKWSVPCVEIIDVPRFSWRGMHLDVGRHFFPKEFIKKYIDFLSSYKMNVFHWHLTEDQGWRIEIKKYPRLVEVGSKRRETMDDGVPYGGFYTQDEIREVVQYAQQRFITVVPEIEMPGHSLAALASYPELSCSGGPFKVGTDWGVLNDVYCAGNEKTFEFLENVINEVVSLFPGQFFHIGGDECPKIRWSNCVRCQNRMRTEGLKDEHELQSYFIKRIEKVLATKGKRLLGWDEILEGGLAPNATVMSWRGMQGGLDAAKSGHDVVMTPTTHCYFDYYQGSEGEPKAIGGFLPLDTVYAFEPIPSEMTSDESNHILGAQGNVWTEWMPTPQQVEYMVLPRLCAMSEVVWSAKSYRNYSDFLRRLENHYDRFDVRGINYRIPTLSGIGGRKVIFKETRVSIINPISTAVIYYTLNGKEPTLESSQYRSPIKVSNDLILKARLVLPNEKMSNTITTTFFFIDPKVNGLEYEYFEGEWDSLPIFARLTPNKMGRIYDVGLNDIPHQSDNFALLMKGFLMIDRESKYTFYLASDDGSKLFIDDILVVDHDGLHGATEQSGSIGLIPGKHRIVLQYFERGGSQVLSLSTEDSQLSKQLVPPRMLTIK